MIKTHKDSFFVRDLAPGNIISDLCNEDSKYEHVSVVVLQAECVYDNIMLFEIVDKEKYGAVNQNVAGDSSKAIKVKHKSDKPSKSHLIETLDSLVNDLEFEKRAIESQEFEEEYEKALLGINQGILDWLRQAIVMTRVRDGAPHKT